MIPKGELPTRANCDPNDPEEFALWAFVALPGLKGAPLLMSLDYYRLVSQRLWDLGFRQVEEPVLEWVPPSGSEPNWTTSPGHWVPAGTAPRMDGRSAAKAVAAKLTAQQRYELLQALTGGDDDLT